MGMPLHRFVEWRAKYDSMSHSEQMTFWDWINSVEPDQAHFHIAQVLRFFNDNQCKNVMEFGGWKGDCANRVLSTFKGIESWDNYDICPTVLNDQHCKDSRYKVIIPDIPVWEISLKSDNYDTFIATHSIEHIKEAELNKLFKAIPESVNQMLLEAPLQSSCVGNRWMNEPCAHILEIGWEQVNDKLKDDWTITNMNDGVFSYKRKTK